MIDRNSLNLSKIAETVLDLLSGEPKLTAPDLVQLTGRGLRTIRRAIDELQSYKIISREGSRKSGYWKVL
jgi:ATP-dependent DNA helicase RecG